MKQAHVALSMNITQQAYSEFESNNENPKLQTLTKFCRVTNVPLSFLLSFDIPINEEMVNIFCSQSVLEILESYRNLKVKVAVFEDLLQRINHAQLSVG